MLITYFVYEEALILSTSTFALNHCTQGTVQERRGIVLRILSVQDFLY